MKPAVKQLLLWGLLILMFVAIWQFLSPPAPPGAHAPPAEPIQIGSWLPTALVAGAFFAAIVAFRRLVAAAAAHNAAFHASTAHLEAGRWEEAERAVESIGQSRLPQFRRAFHVQRAEIAARRGDREGALGRLEQAIAPPLGWIFRGSQRATVIAAQGLRAFLRASAGDEAGAREDIEAVRAAPAAPPTVLARAMLAEARLLDHKGDQAALGALLERGHALLFEATGGRERALVHAYRAMLEAGAASVYRQKGDRAAVSDEAMASAAWVACYAPNAVPFVQAGAVLPRGEGGEVREEAPSDKARHALEAARSRRVKISTRSTTLGLWVVLVMVSLAIWQGFSSGADGVRTVGAAGILMVIVGFCAVIARSVRQSRRDGRRINEAQRAIGAGDLERAVAELDFEPALATRRAERAHKLAQIAWLRGDMAEVVEQCDRAFAALAEAQGGRLIAPTAPAKGRAAAWDFLHLVAAQRALALASLGRADEAWAEIAWAKGFPTAAPIFWVQLLGRLAARDLAGAAGVVAARDPAIGLTPREEALAGLVLFVARPAARSEAEGARLRAELRWDRSLSPWLDAIAPGLVAAFTKADAEVGVARPTSRTSSGEDAASGDVGGEKRARARAAEG